MAHPVLLQHLHAIEPNATFSVSPPRIISSNGFAYFAKTGSPTEAEQYHGEAESLKAIAIAAPGLAPRVLASGVDDSRKPYFLSEYKNLTRLTGDAAKTLGRRMAMEMHTYKSPNGFGFGVPTYYGATRLQNGWFESWEKCYSAMIHDLLTQLGMKGGYTDLCAKTEELQEMCVACKM
jgi:fructosamine-3-kinase